jgi:hypothetical protein
MPDAKKAFTRSGMDGDKLRGGTHEFVAGEGNIREKTIRFGHIILAVSTIDTLALTVKPRNTGLIIVSSVLLGAIAAALVHGVNLDYVVTGLVFLVVVGIGVAIALRWPSESVLAIGTNGGRTYYMAGGKEFLIRLGELIRKKIDSEDRTLTAEFSVAQSEITLAGRDPAAPQRVAPV